MRLILNLSV